MRRTFWPCLAMALALVLLGGCSGKPAPKEPDPSGSVGPETTATPPPLPEAATQETAEGAIAFVEHYLDVLNYATSTGDASGVVDLSASECEACNQFSETIAKIYDAGGQVTGGEWSTDVLAAVERAGYWTVTGDVKTAGGTQQDSRESTPRPAAETSSRVEFIVQRRQSDWVIYSFAGSDG